MKSPCFSPLRHSGAALSLIATIVSAAHATTLTWVGGSGDWNTTAATWNAGTAVWPTAGTDNDAVFGVTAGTVTLPGTITANDLTFSGPDYRLDGGTLTLNGITPTFTVAAGARTTVASVVAGTAGFRKQGSGTLSLHRANTDTGSVTVNAGTLEVVGGGRLFSGTDNVTAVVTVNTGAVLELDSWFKGDGHSLGRLDQGAGRLVVNGGTIRMNGVTGYGRGVTVNAGGATFEAAAGADWMLHSYTDSVDFVYNGNPSLVFTGAGVGSFEKPISGGGSVTKRGPGKWTLRRTNSYTGPTVVEQGMLRLFRASLSDTATVTIKRGGVLELTHPDTDAVGGLVIDGVPQPAGTYGRSTHPQYFTGAGKLIVGGAAVKGTPFLTHDLTAAAAARQDVTDAMNYAVDTYNSVGIFAAHVTGDYNAGIPTAQASYGGWVQFGGSRSGRVAMHEFGHFFGVGTHPNWGSFKSGSNYTGPEALKIVRQIDGPDAALFTDGTHFWPYGLNYDNEGGARNEQVHVRIMAGFRRDLGDLTDPPVLSLPAAWATGMDHATGPIPFFLNDPDSDVAGLRLVASSSNQALIPNSNIVLGGSGSNRTISVTPAPGQTGLATISVMAMDSSNIDVKSMTVGVNAFETVLAAGTDDAEESATGDVALASSDLEMANDDLTGAGDQVVGLRFTGVRVPRGAIVTQATIQFQCDEAQTGAADVEIRAQAADDAATFAAVPHDVSLRPLTSMTVPWRPVTWEIIDQEAAAQRTPNLAALVQEVINRPGWVSGNALAFVVKGTGRRTADAFDKPDASPARLLIQFAPVAETAVSAIASSSDDAEQSAAGAVVLDSSDLELVNDTASGAGDQKVGVRFPGLSIPSGATITDARIQFTTDEAESGAVALTVRAEASDNAATFTTGPNNIGARATTTAAVSWQPLPWATVGSAGAAERTPNLAPLVQAVVDRPGWTPGNALAFIVTGTGRRTAESFDKVGGHSPILTVSYTTGSAAPGSFAQWLSNHPGHTGPPDDDSDGDGAGDFLEFALGLDPARSDAPVMTAEATGATLSLRYQRPVAVSGVDYFVEWSDTLAAGSWSTVGVLPSVESDDGTLRTVLATVPRGTARRWVRLRVASTATP